MVQTTKLLCYKNKSFDTKFHDCENMEKLKLKQY